MATISGGGAFVILMTALSGGLDKPPANWTEVDAHTSQYAYRQLDHQGYLNVNSPGNGTQIIHREKISPRDFFRIIEIAPKAVASPYALKEPPPGAKTLLRIKTSDGTTHYFVGEQEKFQDSHAQEIWTILRKYHSDAW